MNRVSTVFHLSIYGLISVASLMLAFAEGSAYPQALTPPLAILAYFFVERRKVFALPTLLANTAGFVAFILAGWEFFTDDLEGRILSGAHLLVYLTWIVLLQKKYIVEYWWMCALGVLQVAVGSVLTNNETYGGMLIGYMMFSIWTLSVFSLHQAQLQYGAAGEGGKSLQDPRRTAGSQGTKARKATGAVSLSAWLNRPSVSRGTIQHDPNERWLGPQFVLTNLGTAALAMIVASCFFLFIPRLWASRTEWPTGKSPFDQSEISGFSPKVRLGDFGEILESTEKVFELRIFENETNNELDVERYSASIGLAEPLFRGTTLVDYEDATWSGFSRNDINTRELDNNPPKEKEVVRQEFLLQPAGTDILFAMQPIEAGRLTGRSEEIEVQLGTGVLFRPTQISSARPLSYTLYSPAPQPLLRNDSELRENRYRQGSSSERMALYCRKPPGPKLERLTRLGREVSGFNNPVKPTPRERADRIYQYLRYSGEFSYSLDTSIEDDSIDPIEDFLFNRKQGHCKYFSTALALMLRASDVPARLVSGFKGGTINAISGHFEVEQRHAHAWVEAFLYDESGKTGRWITLDATPEAREESVQSFAPRIQTAHDLASFVKGSWSRYVVNLEFGQQSSSFYQPIVDWALRWWNSGDGGRAQITAWFSDTIDILKNPSRWFSFQGAATTFVLLLLLAGLLSLASRSSWFWKLISRFWKRNFDSDRKRVAFYERFENLCANLGLARERAQTQREFGNLVRQRLERFPTNGQLGNIPAAVVASFYRVRFGTQDLSEEEASQIDRQLTLLEQTVIAANGRR